MAGGCFVPPKKFFKFSGVFISIFIYYGISAWVLFRGGAGVFSLLFVLFLFKSGMLATGVILMDLLTSSSVFVAFRLLLSVSYTHLTLPTIYSV